MKVFSLEDPVFKVEPLFVLDCTFDELKHYMRHRHKCLIDYEGQEWAGTMLTFDRAPWRVVWTRRIDLPTLLHETFHLVTRICYDKGIPIVSKLPDGQNGDEAAAYMFEHYAEALCKKLRLHYATRTSRSRRT